MYTRRNIRFSIIWKFAWKNLLIFFIWSFLVTLAFTYFDLEHANIGIPYLPLSTIGIAVAFYLGFKNSQSYDRFWEGRKIWGGIVNYSRTWANQTLNYIQNHPESGLTDDQVQTAKKRLVRRHLAWINTLRIQLRKTTIFDRKNLSYVPDFGLVNDRECQECIAYFLSGDEYDHVKDKANAATHIITMQGEKLAELRKSGVINEYQQVNMMDSLRTFYDYQGMCERIKNTPFPRQYAYFSSVFVWIFVLLLPFGLVEEFHNLGGTGTVWLNIPFSMLISWVFSTMEIVGDNSEDPFENYVNDVPMSAICRTIEIDLLQLIEADDVPEKMEPENDVLL